MFKNTWILKLQRYCLESCLIMPIYIYSVGIFYHMSDSYQNLPKNKFKGVSFQHAMFFFNRSNFYGTTSMSNAILSWLKRALYKNTVCEIGWLTDKIPKLLKLRPFEFLAQ